MASTTTATPTNASITSTISKLRNLNDDIWDDSDDDIVSYHRSMANREWERLHEQHGNVRFSICLFVDCGVWFLVLFYLFLLHTVWVCRIDRLDTRTVSLRGKI